MHEGSLFSTSSPAFIVCRLFDDGHSAWYEVVFFTVLICISLIISNFGHLMSSLEKCLFRSSAHFGLLQEFSVNKKSTLNENIENTISFFFSS